MNTFNLKFSEKQERTGLTINGNEAYLKFLLPTKVLVSLPHVISFIKHQTLPKISIFYTFLYLFYTYCNHYQLQTRIARSQH